MTWHDMTRVGKERWRAGKALVVHNSHLGSAMAESVGRAVCVARGEEDGRKKSNGDGG